MHIGFQKKKMKMVFITQINGYLIEYKKLFKIMICQIKIMKPYLIYRATMLINQMKGLKI